MDIADVPVVHEAEVKLPTVSGSSGRLVVERPTQAEAERSYPDQAFGEAEVDYETAMEQFVTASAAAEAAVQAPPAAVETAEDSLRAQRRRLGHEQEAVRSQRRQVRQQRQREDGAWREMRRLYDSRWPLPTAPTDPATARDPLTRREMWRTLRQQRHDTLVQRRDLQAGLSSVGLVAAWYAVLLITDNCSRKGYGVPLLTSGPHVTAAEVTAALQPLLPPGVRFVITDRGVQFTAQEFDDLALAAHFLHVLIARHRPQSNGIVERLVRTLKEWLADKVWQSEADLLHLLAQFLAEYNDRPHQGLPIPGLSPNKYERRLWLL